MGAEQPEALSGDDSPPAPKPQCKGARPGFFQSLTANLLARTCPSRNAAVLTWAPSDPAGRERTPRRAHLGRGPVSAPRPSRRRPRALCRPAPHPPGSPARGARAARGRVRAEGGGGGGAARGPSASRQQVGASSRERARAAPSPSRSRLSASPPRQERAPPALALGRSRCLRGAHSPELLPRPSPRPWLSSPRLKPRPLRAASQSSSPSATPLPFPALLSHRVHRESLDTKRAGLRRGLEKWRCRAWIMPSTAPPAPVRR